MKSKHKKLSAEEKLRLYKEFIRSNNRRKLARQWDINPTTMYCIVQECEANLLAFLQDRRPGPKGKGTPKTFMDALKRIKELEKKCNRYEADIQRFYTKCYLGETHKDKIFPVSQKEYYSRLWIMDVLQGRISAAQLETELSGKIDAADIRILLNCAWSDPRKLRNQVLVVLSFLKGVPKPTIGKFLHLAQSRVGAYIEKFEMGGVKLLLKRERKDIKKFENPKYIDAVFAILHSTPSCYGINRTTWKLADISKIMGNKGLPISRQTISKIIKNAGYQLQKAKKVLTSTDPDYREKLKKITGILSNLKQKEKFFSIDEFGPFSIKMQGGRSFVPKGKPKIVPQWQRSKGRLIVTAALELSTNQITHFFSEKKNTDEMLKLLSILMEQYKTEDCIYLSWDAAKWHTSKKLYKKVEEINSPEYKKRNQTPLVKLAPLPARSQFLNVIESVFSGMAKAIIHNSDYQYIEECMSAIDRYFAERNENFKKNPKRAGKKIWGEELVVSEFSESNNCKYPYWR
jgi:transposase-like protein/transposase